MQWQMPMCLEEPDETLLFVEWLFSSRTQNNDESAANAATVNALAATATVLALPSLVVESEPALALVVVPMTAGVSPALVVYLALAASPETQVALM